MEHVSTTLKEAYIHLMGANVGLRVPYDFLEKLLIDLIEDLNDFVEAKGPNYQLHENEVIAKTTSAYTNVAGETRDIQVRVVTTSTGYRKLPNLEYPASGLTGIENDIIIARVFVEASSFQLLGDGTWLMQAFQKKLDTFKHELVHAIDPALSRITSPASKSIGQTEGNAYLLGIYEDIQKYTDYRGEDFFERLRILQRAADKSNILHDFLLGVSINYRKFYHLFGSKDQRALRRVLQKVYTFLEGEIDPIINTDSAIRLREKGESGDEFFTGDSGN